jgi:hypothetical protein
MSSIFAADPGAKCLVFSSWARLLTLVSEALTVRGQPTSVSRSLHLWRPIYGCVFQEFTMAGQPCFARGAQTKLRREGKGVLDLKGEGREGKGREGKGVLDLKGLHHGLNPLDVDGSICSMRRFWEGSQVVVC